MTKHDRLSVVLGSGLLIFAACGDDDDADEPTGDYEARATLDVKKYVDGQLDALHKASMALQAAAPGPDADGWNADEDAAALEEMRAAWADARDAYERVEGSIALLFPELDTSTDQRYDAFIADDGPDDNLFDGEGVTGMHAIERILWADSIPEHVARFESREVEGYLEAAFPANEEQASQFKNELCERLVTETKQMKDDYSEGTTLDASAAFFGMIGSMAEQSEKTTLGASGEDESRYAERTLDDMRANLDGARAVFKAFRAWIVASNGAGAAAEIEAGLDAIGDAYAEVKGAALPDVPDGFNPDEPTDDDLATPYGRLWALLEAETDPNSNDSLVSKMTGAANKMGIEEYEE